MTIFFYLRRGEMLRPSHFHISVLSRVPLAWAATSCTKREFCSIDLLRLLCSLNLLKLTSEIQKHKQRYSLVVFHIRCCDVPKILRKNHRTIGGSVLAGKGGPRGWLRPDPCWISSEVITIINFSFDWFFMICRCFKLGFFSIHFIGWDQFNT